MFSQVKRRGKRRRGKRGEGRGGRGEGGGGRSRRRRKEGEDLVVVVVGVFTRENRGGSAQHATRTTPRRRLSFVVIQS